MGLPYEIRLHKRDPKSRSAPPALKQVHPLGKSPVIEDGGRVIAKSGAIIDYILRRYGNGRLQPAPSDTNYDDYVHWLHYAEGSGMPALIIRISVARVGEAAATALSRLDAEIALQLGYLNDALEGRPYILGEELSAADVQLSFIGELAAARFGNRWLPEHRGLGEEISGAVGLQGGAGEGRRLQFRCVTATATGSPPGSRHRRY